MATIDLSTTGLTFNTSDGGKTAWMAAWNGRPPREGDYLLLSNGPNKLARYKVTDVDVPMNVDPPTMWTATVRHAPSTHP